MRSALLPLLALATTGCGALTDLLLGPDVPNPFEGEDTLLIELSCEAAGAAAAANLVGQRMTLLGLRHSVTAHPSGQLSITTTNAAQGQADAMAALLVATPELGFHAVLEDQAPLRPRHDPPEEAVLDAFPATGGRPDMAFDVEAMQAMLALAGGALPPVEGVRIEERFDDREVYAAPSGTDWRPWLDTLPLPEGAEVVTECWKDQGEEELCSPLLVETPPSVTAANVASAEIAIDEQFYTPHLELVFDEQGKQAFHALSERLVGRYLAIVSDGHVLSRPKVMEPIPGGRAWLNVGYGMDEHDLLDLWRFYSLLETGPLPGPCSVRSSEVAP
jgi:hypothetical protein